MKKQINMGNVKKALALINHPDLEASAAQAVLRKEGYDWTRQDLMKFESIMPYPFDYGFAQGDELAGVYVVVLVLEGKYEQVRDEHILVDDELSIDHFVASNN